MTTTSVRGRIPAGVPTGGQFASLARTEPGLTLLDDVGSPGRADEVLGSLAVRGVDIADARPDELDALSFHANDSVREMTARVVRDPFALDRLARDEVAWVRRAAATNPHAPETMVEDLTNDPSADVRDQARTTLRNRRAQQTAAKAAQHPVTGPGRARAATRAIAALAAARTAREADPWSETTHTRLVEAQRVRDLYPEYDDYRAR